MCLDVSFCNCSSRISTISFHPSPLLMVDSVNWDCWNRTEDWYDTQCPGKPHVDLGDIPGCARSCFGKANVCKEMTSNYVCSQPRPNCNSTTTTCKSTEVGWYDAWYTRSCKYNPTTTTTSVSNPSTTASSTNSTSVGSTSPVSTGGGGGGGGLSKGAITGVAVGAVTGTLALGIFLCSCWKQKDSAGRDCGAEAPPGLQEMEDSSNAKATPGRIPGVVQSAPLVEAPGDPR